MANGLPIERAVTAAGGISKLAAALGVTPPTVHEWITHKRAVPASRCQAIVRFTKGAVSLQELRPNDWADYWPNLLDVNNGHLLSPACTANGVTPAPPACVCAPAAAQQQPGAFSSI